MAAPLPLPPLAPMQSGLYGPAPGWAHPSNYPGPPFPQFLYYFHDHPRPRVWTVFVAYLAALLSILVVGSAVMLVLIAVRHFQELDSADLLAQFAQESMTDPDMLLPALLSMQVALVACALVAAWLSPTPLVKRLRLGPSTLPPAAYPLVALGAVAIGLLFMVCIQFLHLPESKDLKFLNEAIQHLTPWQAVAAVLVIGGAPAFGEEWFFRGYMQTRLGERWGRWPAIFITAVLFGVMHLNVVQGLFAMILGVYIGYVAEKSGSVRPGMACHFANNALQVVLARYSTAWNISETTQNITIGVLAVVLVAAIVYLVIGVRPPPQPAVPTEPRFAPPYPPPYFAPSTGMAWPPSGM